MISPTYAEMIDRHYTKNWGAPTNAIRLNRGPIADLPNDFRVLVLNRAPDMVAFATQCMSQPTDKDRLEIHALCSPDDAGRSDLVEILTAVAHYHRTGSLELPRFCGQWFHMITPRWALA
jgi:hypothetical protein